MRREQFFFESAKHNFVTKAKRPLNKLKHEKETGVLLFLVDEKNFGKVQEVSRKKIGNYLKSSKRLRLSDTENFQFHWWFWRVVNSEDDLMPKNVFLQGVTVNAVVYTEAVKSLDYFYYTRGRKFFTLHHPIRLINPIMDGPDFHEHAILKLLPSSSSCIKPTGITYVAWLRGPDPHNSVLGTWAGQ